MAGPCSNSITWRFTEVACHLTEKQAAHCLYAGKYFHAGLHFQKRKQMLEGLLRVLEVVKFKDPRYAVNNFNLMYLK